jgi:hypothetical protein
MNVKITETGKIELLSIRDKNGIDWTNDLIGNTGAFSDGLLVWSEEDDAYEANQETFDWWSEYISGYEATETEIEELASKLNIDPWIIRERIGKAQDTDYEYHRGCAITAMQEIEEEYAE